MDLFDDRSLFDKIEKADRVFVGIGSELQITLAELENNSIFRKKKEELSNYRYGEEFYPYLIKYFLNTKDIQQEKLDLYNRLYNKISKKDFFIVSLCTDDTIFSSNIAMDRVVAPCGGYRKLQCTNGCSDDLIDIESKFWKIFSGWINDGESIESIILPKCTKCSSQLVFNQVGVKKYIENDYLPQWEKYTKWLQSTINRSLVILELGVGMEIPSVIRWPMEKVAFYNQKSVFYRVHEKLYQLPDNLDSRGFSVNMSALDFIDSYF